ncbi:hypothetical protein AV530_009341 [Patagioenas fasciata monilis]|uniref:Uncharacterized protein n=1 Tax=Patagioenas fasciata monilis TaxID=372326 RepID=A0A1V4JIM8_PATFA|nr:hypothetical protein AV530_009341 [Patagioenas fasciata monilis]
MNDVRKQVAGTKAVREGGQGQTCHIARASIWKIHEWEEEMNRTKLQCLKMFQRHNWSCRREKKEQKKKDPCLTGAATTGSFFTAAAADSALKG